MLPHPDRSTSVNLGLGKHPKHLCVPPQGTTIYYCIQWLTLQDPRLAADILQSPRFSVESLNPVQVFYGSVRVYQKTVL